MSVWGRRIKYSINSSYSNEDEESPLLDSMTVGASSDTLVSSSGVSSKFPQYVAALCATLGGFVMGTIMAWTSPVNIKIDKEVHFPIEKSYKDLIGALVNIGAMVGALIVPTLCNIYGRKKGMVFLAIPSTIGWALLIWAENVGMLLAGRILLGIVAGSMTVVCPMYTTEIAESSIRGTLGTFFQLQITLGIFFDYVVGNQVSIFNFNIICAIFPLLLGLLMSFMPESPYFYLMKKNNAAAEKSLQWLRGKHYNVSGEIQVMKTSIEKMEAEKLSIREAFSTVPAKRGLIIGIGIMFFQQFSGINGVIFFTSDIFKSAGASLKPSTSSIIVGGVSVVATYLSTIVIDKLGRKPLLLLSDSVMALSAAVLGVFFYLKDNDHDVSNIGWVPVTSLSVFIIVFSLGLGPIPWMFIGEIFPPAIKGPASSIACVFNWLCAFLVTFFFKSISDTFHSSFTFWGFAVISAIGTVFIIFLIPETKGKSLEEIQRNLGGNSSSSNTNYHSGEKNDVMA